jgi:hypothetical protein
LQQHFPTYLVVSRGQVLFYTDKKHDLKTIAGSLKEKSYDIKEDTAQLKVASENAILVDYGPLRAESRFLDMFSEDVMSQHQPRC